MAKNRNKKKSIGSTSMHIDDTVHELPQAMDVTDSGVQKAASGVHNLKLKKGGRPMKRSKNVRKMKAVAKAISKNEQSSEKILKNKRKTARIQSAKTLYES